MLRASSTMARTGPAIQQTPDRWLEINEQLNLCHRTKTRGDYREQRDKPTRLCPGRPLQTFAVPTSKRPCLPECFLRFIRGSIFPGQAGGAELPSLGVALGQYRREPGMWLLQLHHPGCGHREDGSSRFPPLLLKAMPRSTSEETTYTQILVSVLTFGTSNLHSGRKCQL